MRGQSWFLTGLVGIASGSMPARADEAAVVQPPAIIVTAPGGAIDMDDARAIDARDIAAAGTPDILAALTRNIAGITLQDAQGNPWQPNLVHRGFTASPLQGQSQGIAVYMDGARFNQPFGDTVQFDLIPEAAIRSVSLLDASPVYGLNALGGALLLETKDGRAEPGFEASATGGRFGYAEASVAGGFADGAFSSFGAVQYSRERGWRDHSPSRLVNGYLDLGLDGTRGGIHMKLVGANTDLTGNGVAPVELLAADRRAVFTWPDNSRSRYGRVSLHPWVALSDTSRLEGSIYAQHLTLRTINGDAADIEACEDDDAEGLLCLETAGAVGDAAILTTAGGEPVPDRLGGEGYGVLNRGRTRTEAAGFLVQIVDDRSLAGGRNHLAIGISHDRGRTRFDASTELGALTEDRSVTGLGSVIVQSDGAIAPVGLVAHNRHWGIFLQDRLPIAPGLTAEIGLRWNHARIELVDQIGTALNGRHSFRRLNPGIEFDYRLSDGLSLRAGYAETSRAPTPAELSCADEAAPCSLTNFFIADPPLSQVVARSWEAGASGHIASGGWSADWLLSAYRTTNHDDIQYVASAIRGRAYFRNIGKTRRQGLEASLKLKRGGFAAGLGYAFTDATYRDSLVLSSPANPVADEDGTIGVQRGDTLPGISRHSATLTLDYAGTAGGRRWSVGGDVIARSGQYLVGDEGNDNARLPGYLIANIRAGIDILPGMTLFGEVRNLLGRRYATFGTFAQVGEIDLEEAPGASDPRAYGPGAPRRWYMGVKARF
ncbi:MULTISPECIES: TonB-dependent receptor [unclassified Sphingobium]|uniref:TonB-dependent receptor n=1 Tax=unclassified Sphingobium TaxID=2611147 RepID=UPI0035A66EEE